MKLPRNINGDELTRRLSRYGYRVAHQTGSHQRLTANVDGRDHDITIPRHKPLRVGTLHAILTDVARHQKISREQIIAELFG
ncbi:type II toxin-antitoxin system HicA family toxin [Methanoregula sp.]|uniref:type II toxin-antitoxin system HicA family toxin n=1 Tax=Methanoregula sp. TaxID=2052170 RepID=UPI003C1648CF